MKRSRKILLTLILLVTVSASLSASSLIREITGKENKGISVTFNGVKQTLKDGHGNVIYPVIIDGSSYLPVKAITEMAGCEIAWDGATKTIAITRKEGTPADAGAVPTDLPNVNDGKKPTHTPSAPANPTTTPSTTPSTSTNAGTLEDPIAFGTSFTYDDFENYNKEYETNARYNITVTGMEVVTRDEIAELGFERPEDNPLYDYALVTLKVNASNIKLLGTEYRFLSNVYPEVWGISTPQGSQIICGTDYGFDQSFQKAMDNAVGFQKVNNDNKTHSYEVEGKVLVTIFKNIDNYLVIERGDSTLEYDTRKIFFKLK